MLGAIPVARVFGITIRVHVIWLLGLIAIAALVSEPFTTLIDVLMLFAIVILHELGHSLMARHYKLHVIDITLLPLGGMARMSEMPESSKIEGMVALAGPAVNFALAALASPIWILWFLNDAPASGGMLDGALTLGLHFFAFNLMMGVFNLIPAFPMDGGRVLRSVLALFTDWLTATKRAVAVGKVFALGMIGFGLVFFSAGTVLLPMIGVFIWVMGAQELMGVRRRHGDLPGFRGHGPRTTSYRIESPPSEPERDDPSGARRPSDNPLDGAPGKLSDEELAKLERFHGRLRKPSDPAE